MSATTEGIVILGAPRSGTTLLRRLLDAHPRIACPGETYVLSSCARFLRDDHLANGLSMGALSGLAFAGFGETDVMSRLRDFAFAFHREYARRRNKPRWAEKTAIDVFYLEEIERLCGDDVFFIGLLRHGLDVACSCEELVAENGAIPLELHEYIKRDNKPLAAYCRAWVDATRGLLDFANRHPNNSILCRYEDLVNDPDTVLKGIVAALGEVWEDDLVARAMAQRAEVGLGDWKTYRRNAIDSSSTQRWSRLSQACIARLAGIVNPTLIAAGYAPVSVDGPADDAAEARRRYELGLLVQSARRPR